MRSIVSVRDQFIDDRQQYNRKLSAPQHEPILVDIL